MDIIAVHIPTEPSDIDAIQSIIAGRDIIRTVYSDSEFDRYSLGAYLKEVHVHQGRFVALLDRNILSDIIAVAKGSLTGIRNISATQRVACAFLAFCQLSETLIEPGLAIYECIYFSGQRFGRMLKSLNSGQADKVRKGLKNAAWDMTVVHYWSKKAIGRRSEGEYWLLCTADRAMKEVATHTASSYESRSDLDEKTKALFAKYPGNRNGSDLYNFYCSLVERHDDSGRKINMLKSQKALYPVINRLEQEFFR